MTVQKSRSSSHANSIFLFHKCNKEAFVPDICVFYRDFNTQLILGMIYLIWGAKYNEEIDEFTAESNTSSCII